MLNPEPHSVPTAVEESNDIITDDYPDEAKGNTDSPDRMAAAYER